MDPIAGGSWECAVCRTAPFAFVLMTEDFGMDLVVHGWNPTVGAAHRCAEVGLDDLSGLLEPLLFWDKQQFCDAHRGWTWFLPIRACSNFHVDQRNPTKTSLPGLEILSVFQLSAFLTFVLPLAEGALSLLLIIS